MAMHSLGKYDNPGRRLEVRTLEIASVTARIDPTLLALP